MSRIAVILTLLATPALAQVSVNQGALDRLQPSATPASPSGSAQTSPSRGKSASAKAKPKPAAARKAQPAPAAAPTAKPKPKPRPTAVAPAPPPAPVLAPVVEAPKPVTVPPPVVPVVADAVGTATTLAGGTRITFGEGKSDLNPATAAALQTLARAAKADPTIDLNVFAYASGPADDPSTSRRLSLSRALAARAVLIGEGIVSTRIYVRAMGNTGTAADAPPERVDVLRSGVDPAKP